MGTLEIIDRLCEATTLLADVVREQAVAIEQSNIEQEIKDDLQMKRKIIDEKMDIIEFHTRRVIDTDTGELRKGD